MKNFQVITLQQETFYESYIKQCKENDQETSAANFIEKYKNWCFEESLFEDLASYQYHEQEEGENQDLDEEDGDFKLAVWTRDDNRGCLNLTSEDQKHLSDEQLMELAVTEFRKNLRDEEDYCDEDGETKYGQIVIVKFLEI